MLNHFKPFNPALSDMLQRGDIVTVPKGTTITRWDKNRDRVEKTLQRDITVTLTHAGFGDVSWGSRRANEGMCNANDVIPVTWQHGEPTVSFGYLRDILPFNESRYVAWHVNGVSHYPALGEDLDFIGRPSDYHCCRMTLGTARTLYNRIREHYENDRVERDAEVAKHGPLGALVRRIIAS